MRSDTHFRSAWLILFVLLLASMAAPVNQFKVPPALPLLMNAFSLSVGRAGLLMSLFAVTGLILALPAGFFVQKLGYRITGLMAVGSLVVGAAMGAVSTGTGIILASRIIEGVGLSLMFVVAPAVIAIWFAADKRGTPMGIWATFVPLGSTLIFVLAPLLVARWNWQGLWWFGCIFSLVGWLLYYFFIKPVPVQSSGKSSAVPSEGMSLLNLGLILRNRDLWLVSFVFFCFNYVFIAFLTWTPTFMNAHRGMSMVRASLLISVVSMSSIFSPPISGWISDKIGSRKLVYMIPMILLAVLLPLVFSMGERGFLPLFIAIGFIGGCLPPAVFSAGVEAVGDERFAGMAMAVIQVGQNAGMLLGPLVFGWVVESAGGWQMSFWTLFPVCAIGAIAGWIAKVR